MAVPVIQSKNNDSGITKASLVITKPTGLAVGDLLVCIIGGYDTGTFNTPAGWTLEESYAGAGSNRAYCFSKIADSGDVAASNFTFSVTAGNFDYVSGTLFRITGHTPTNYITVTEVDQSTSGTESSLSYTTALTPANINSLLLFSYGANNADPNGVPTVGSYGSTPSATWTEEADLGLDSGGLGNGFAFGIASAPYTGLTEITGRTAVLSDGGAGNFSGNHGMAIIVNGIADAQGTNATFAVSPSFFSENGLVTAQGSNALLAVFPTIPTQSGKGTRPTQWNNQTKPAVSTVNNLNKP